MADVKTCDTCGTENGPAHRIEVGVMIEGIVVEGAATGHSEEADTCNVHEDATIDALHNLSRLQVKEQAPYHKEMLGLTEKRGALERVLDTDAAMEVEAARIKVAERATEASDRRRAEFFKALKKRK